MKKGFATAEIIKIAPYFKKQQTVTEWLSCSYRFESSDRVFFGRSVLPVSFFLHCEEGPYIELSNNGYPVLKHDDLIVGEEALEHFFLQRKSELRIQYLLDDPGRNFVVFREGLLDRAVTF